VKAYDGKTLKLEDFKGKFVFLDFWATWAGARNLDAQMLKAVHETYAKDSRLVMIGDELRFRGVDRREVSRRRMASNGRRPYAGPWGQGAVYQSYGLEGLPDNVLIDPEGKVAARNLRGSNIRNTIRNRLGNPRAAPAAAQP
jgi:thiol-disulfide isomerase/thioredoxin